MSVKLSIIVPVYNTEEFLIQCLDSIKNQILNDFECILVDDGSSDKSGKICDDFVKTDGRFSVFHIANSGVSNARNFGIEKATGEYITFVDSDDFIESNAYQHILDLMEKDDAEVGCFNFYRFYSIGDSKKIKFNDKKDLYENFISYPINMNSLCNKVVKRNLFIDNEIRFNPDISVSEDLLVSFEILSKSVKVSYSSEYLYYYRVNCFSATNSAITQRKIDDTYKVYEAIKQYCFENSLQKKAKKYIRYLNASAVRPYLVCQAFFNPAEFRKLAQNWNVWNFSFRPDLFLTYFFCFLHLDFICKFLLVLKG